MTDLIDLDRYPIHERESPEGKALVADVQARLADDGCCRLSGFLTERALSGYGRALELHYRRSAESGDGLRV